MDANREVGIRVVAGRSDEATDRHPANYLYITDYKTANYGLQIARVYKVRAFVCVSTLFYGRRKWKL